MPNNQNFFMKTNCFPCFMTKSLRIFRIIIDFCYFFFKYFCLHFCFYFYWVKHLLNFDFIRLYSKNSHCLLISVRFCETFTNGRKCIFLAYNFLYCFAKKHLGVVKNAFWTQLKTLLKFTTKNVKLGQKFIHNKKQRIFRAIYLPQSSKILHDRWLRWLWHFPCLT